MSVRCGLRSPDKGSWGIRLVKRSSASYFKRSAFTLVELLVVIAIIGILVALLLPAIQAAREAARRAKCQNNLKNIALGVLNYETARKHYPPGFVGMPVDGQEGWAWSTFTLPYLEEQSVYDQMRPSETCIQPTPLGTRTGKRNMADMMVNAKAGVAAELAPLQTPITVFRCPSDNTPDLIPGKTGSFTNSPAAVAPCGQGQLSADADNGWDRYFNGIQVSSSNYVGVKGEIDSGCPFGDTQRCGNTGVFFGDSQISSKQITDGTSKTFMVGERSWFCFAATWVGVRNPVGPDGWSSNWALGHVGNPHGRLNYPCTRAHNSCTEGFSSAHPGGGFFGFCDGSVHFINDDINFDNLNQVDSDSNGTPCYAAQNTTNSCITQNKTTGAFIGVYQRLAWRNDSIPIDGSAY